MKRREFLYHCKFIFNASLHVNEIWIREGWRYHLVQNRINFRKSSKEGWGGGGGGSFSIQKFIVQICSFLTFIKGLSGHLPRTICNINVLLCLWYCAITQCRFHTGLHDLFLLVVFCAFAVVELFVAVFDAFARRRKKSQNVEQIYLIV